MRPYAATISSSWRRVLCATVALATLAFVGACSDGTASKQTSTAAVPLVCDVTPPTSCTDPTLDYAAIEPILQQRCLQCHGGQPGGPWPLDAYEHVADWANEIRAQLSSCTMPPADAGIPITSEEREKVLLWVRCGAPK